MNSNECPDCGSTNGPKMCIDGKCLDTFVHTECDDNCVAPKEIFTRDN